MFPIPVPKDPNEVDFDKEIDVNIDVDVELDWEINFDKFYNVDIDVNTDVDIEDNLTSVTIEAEAFGENTLVEIDAAVLTTDYLSSAAVSIISAVDDGDHVRPLPC